MQEDSTISLQDAVNMSSWPHNTNVNTLDFALLQLVTRKNVIFPGASSWNIATEPVYDIEGVRRIMERHRMLMKEFREQEFTKKLETLSKTRFKGFQDEVIEEEDLVFYHAENKKAWLGTVKIFMIKENAVYLFANGSMRNIL